MTITTLFGEEEVPDKPRSIKFKTIKAIYETLVIKEEIAAYFPPATRFTSPSQIHDIFGFLKYETKEHFITLHLDAKNKIICIDQVSTGSVSQAIVDPRHVFQTALLSNAAAIVLLHNHPSLDPSPSREDRNITSRLKEAGDLLNVKVLDHIIVGDTYMSFVEMGLL